MEESQSPRLNPLMPELLPQMMPSPQALLAQPCFRCGTSTLVSQEHSITHVPLCNACAAYVSQRSQQRMAEDLLAKRRRDGLLEDAASSKGTRRCPHCGTRRTSTSQDNSEDVIVCNACGMYVKGQGQERAERVEDRSGEGDDSDLTRSGQAHASVDLERAQTGS
ncbi:unnamed protein product [Mycena citricolor]|uniref:GATA-type domain-containing protein n=1 Tax=Mycena citricolor TaxID=2018698 RepID=A0AAD2HG78_9AGAR|nr:unnamed protein product [Mycena citricolor]CAK5275212.1 unnamed protein product [Mycena citricolor]